MSNRTGRARVGQWYQREDQDEIFLVTGYDDRSRTIEIQSFNGDLDEIDDATWRTLPLELAEPPEEWTTPNEGGPEFDGLPMEDLMVENIVARDRAAR
jgi:hypothetical protein